MYLKFGGLPTSCSVVQHHIIPLDPDIIYIAVEISFLSCFDFGLNSTLNFLFPPMVRMNLLQKHNYYQGLKKV